MKFIISIIFFLNTHLLFAQSGPVVPCVNCENFTERPKPITGTWYNPDQSGTGFSFDIQNDKLVGFYYGFDEQGVSTWWLFSGKLEEAEQAGDLWEISTELQRFIDGNCINCQYSGTPELAESPGTIHILFDQIGHASFSVNDGAVQNIVPLYFGYPTKQFFPEGNQYKTPEIEGWWAVYEHRKVEGIPEVYTTIIEDVYLGRWDYDLYQVKNTWVSSGSYFPSAPEILDIGFFRCGLIIEELKQITKCIYYSGYFLEGVTYNIPLANITADRIFGESENGDIIEMKRLYFDMCIFNDPNYCINTTLGETQ